MTIDDRASEPQKDKDIKPAGKERWYGWQTLLGLAGSHALLVAGAVANQPVVIGVGISGHFFVGPITHWAHGHVGRGFGALGINVGVPLGGALLGVALGSPGGDTGLAVGGVIGAFVGVVVAPIIDVVALSYEPVEPSTKDSARLTPSRVSLVPLLGPGQKGASLSIQF